MTLYATAYGAVKTDWRSAMARCKSALMRRGRTEEDAEDLVHEAWIRLARVDGHQRIEKPEAFLMRVALNLSVDMHRSAQSRGEAVLLEHVVLVDVAPNVEVVLLARERIARLGVCIARLSEKTRAVLLAHRQGYAAAHGLHGSVALMPDAGGPTWRHAAYPALVSLAY